MEQGNRQKAAGSSHQPARDIDDWHDGNRPNDLADTDSQAVPASTPAERLYGRPVPGNLPGSVAITLSALRKWCMQSRNRTRFEARLVADLLEERDELTAQNAQLRARVEAQAVDNAKLGATVKTLCAEIDAMKSGPTQAPYGSPE